MKTTRTIVLFVLFGLTGCFSLGYEAPPERHYVLGGARMQDAGMHAASLAGISVGLRRLQLADYLETKYIVVRHGPHQVRLSEFNRWGEDLRGGVNRTVAGYLLARSSVEAVDVVPWTAGARHDYLIQVNVLRFEGVVPQGLVGPEGEAYLLATWEIIGGGDRALLARGTTDYRESGWRVGDFDSLVNLLDAGLLELSDDLLAALATLVGP